MIRIATQEDDAVPDFQVRRFVFIIDIFLYARDTIKRMENSEQQLIRLEEKIDAVYASVEKSRRHILTMVIITVATIVLPILLGALLLPSIISSIGGMYGI